MTLSHKLGIGLIDTFFRQDEACPMSPGFPSTGVQCNNKRRGEANFFRRFRS